MVTLHRATLHRAFTSGPSTETAYLISIQVMLSFEFPFFENRTDFIDTGTYYILLLTEFFVSRLFIDSQEAQNILLTYVSEHFQYLHTY